MSIDDPISFHAIICLSDVVNSTGYTVTYCLCPLAGTAMILLFECRERNIQVELQNDRNGNTCFLIIQNIIKHVKVNSKTNTKRVEFNESF